MAQKTLFHLVYKLLVERLDGLNSYLFLLTANENALAPSAAQDDD